MSAQNNLEKILKEIHVMVAECPKLKGDMDKVVMDKNVLFAHLDRVSQCFYDMLDEFELTKQKKKEAEYQLKQKYEQMIEEANTQADDVYSASVLYTDEAITRLVRLLDDSEKSVELLYWDFEKKLIQERDRIRQNQKELQDILFELKDSNTYLGLMNERRRILKEQAEELKKHKENTSYAPYAPTYPAPEIKINKKYFEQMGLNEDGTPKAKEEKKAEPIEVKIDMNSNYFKWKNSKNQASESDKADDVKGGVSADEG